MSHSAGMLIAIEGPKAAGKSSLIERLRENEGCRDWVFTKEPTAAFNLDNEQAYSGAELAALIRSDRARHVDEVIAPALASGRVVITDRYVLSGLVFQSIDGVPIDDLIADNASFPTPDITQILITPSHEIRSRKRALGLETRISALIDEDQESQLYIEYVRHCRKGLLLSYNETWSDCDENVRHLINAVTTN